MAARSDAEIERMMKNMSAREIADIEKMLGGCGLGSAFGKNFDNELKKGTAQAGVMAQGLQLRGVAKSVWLESTLLLCFSRGAVLSHVRLWQVRARLS